MIAMNHDDNGKAMQNKHKNKVIVLGTGNAALSAAMSALDHGASVTILEKAPKPEFGGNTRLTTAALRVSFTDPNQIREILDQSYTDNEWSSIEIEPYPNDKFIYEVIHKTGHGRPNPELVEWFTNQSLDIIHWLKDRGVRFELAEYLSQFDLTKQHGSQKRTYRGGVVIQAVKGGAGMVQPELAYAKSKGAEVHYEMPAEDLITNDKGHVVGVVARDQSGTLCKFHGTVVIGSGGFEASSARRSQFLGSRWCDLRQRCVKFNTGEMIFAAVNAGAAMVGHYAGAHITPIDPDSPFTGGLNTCERTNRLAFSWGITVNKQGHRFIDEGSHWNNQIYVDVGRALLDQPDQIGYQVFDARGATYREPLYAEQKQFFQGNDLKTLAEQAGIAPDAFMKTIEAFNKAAKHNTHMYDPTQLDSQSTKGLDLPKTNWALPIKEKPFSIYPVVPGVTFTFGGLASNTHCQILASNMHPIPGLFGCGEATGDYFYYAYPTGSGLIKGAVTGREAGKQAASYAKQV
ncbi:Fumarate reductase flavoprotein subunit precursor [Poriferisphaera corsica]|uniref:Fumarate reductase flavoprotein subunit n=1 Tax=Poriferisphaera corsica TaxID=2528020 RepID=A0A517YXP6_9BACT|nr:FAD-dependent tricarballylate dehydrogenase TcuA [Poriferisphaera corsica]QDU34998.1 Fumarate reductase flavoprotein subunit precursor [Poriferisphaera corsica]